MPNLKEHLLELEVASEKTPVKQGNKIELTTNKAGGSISIKIDTVASESANACSGSWYYIKHSSQLIDEVNAVVTGIENRQAIEKAITEVLKDYDIQEDQPFWICLCR